MKKCSKCGQVKSLEEFYKSKQNKDGLCGRCKECLKEQGKRYRQNNKEKKSIYDKKHYKKNTEKIKEYQQEYQQKNPEKIRIRSKKYRKKYRKKLLIKKKEYREKNPEKIKKQREKYRRIKKNQKKIKIDKKEYFQKNKERINKQKCYRKKTDTLFKLRINIRGLIYSSFKRKGWGKTSQTQEILGCTFELFKQYLENQFQEGMILENHGEWHIDHRIPLATAKTKEDVIRLCHYSNLQPLWAFDNLSKGAKI